MILYPQSYIPDLVFPRNLDRVFVHFVMSACTPVNYSALFYETQTYGSISYAGHRYLRSPSNGYV